jgi:hypothetical protein
VAEAIGVDDPPATPMAGQAWIIGPAPTGDWSGHADALALWTDGGWRLVTPVPGMAVWVPSLGVDARYDGTAWQVGDVVADRLSIGGVQVVGARQAAVAMPSGGAVIDAQARSAISAILAALAAHGLVAS